MGAADEGSPAEGLLRQRSAGRDGGRRARTLRRLFRNERRTGVRVARRRRQLDSDRPGSSAGALGRGSDPQMIRVELPPHLRTLAKVKGEVTIEVEGTVTQRRVLDALEANYPMLKGAIRDH